MATKLPQFNISNMVCNNCNKFIDPMKPHRIVMDVIGYEFTDHFYEHVECPS